MSSICLTDIIHILFFLIPSPCLASGSIYTKVLSKSVVNPTNKQTNNDVVPFLIMMGSQRLSRVDQPNIFSTFFIFVKEWKEELWVGVGPWRGGAAFATTFSK